MIGTGTAPYVHILDGRIRIKIPEVKGSPRTASRLEQALSAHPGITSVSANPVTGSLLIFFDSDAVDQQAVCAAIQAATGHSISREQAPAAPVPSLPPDELGNAIARIIVEAAVETAVKRLVFALF